MENIMNNNNMLITSMNQFIADLAILNIKLHNLHWNVTGDNFFTLHEKTHEYYKKVGDMFDETAERIKMFNHYPVANTKIIFEMSEIKNIKSKDYNTDEVLNYIINDFKYMSNKAKHIANLATKMNDLNTIDIFSSYVKYFEKQLWMLNAMYKNK